MDCVEKAPGSRRSAQPARVNLALKADFREVNSFSTIASNESSIPDHVRQFIAKTVFVAHDGSFYYVDMPFIVPRELTSTNEDIRRHPTVSFTDMAPSMCTSPQNAPFGWQTMTDVDRGLVHRRMLSVERRQTDIYKTALCREYRGTGKCSYGDGCRFAHGAGELRLPPQARCISTSTEFGRKLLQAHPKYKTQLCNKFALFGTCPYGARCQFIHRRPSEFNYAKEENRDVKSVGPSNIQSRIPSRFDAPFTDLPSRSVKKMSAFSKYLLSDDVNCAESCGENEETEIRFNGSLPSSHFKRATTSRWNHAPTLDDVGITLLLKTFSVARKVFFAELQHSFCALGLVIANTISQKNEHMMSNKAIGVEARCEASAILPSYGHGSTPGMDEFGNTLDNWLLDDSEGVFSQSCFPRLRSHPF
uniref:C3H1-type domain-containing protein n=1 Tax=Ascaris lumbricoides TaxID=6252 RepID=A0A9J2PCL2_ASCLU